MTGSGSGSLPPPLCNGSFFQSDDQGNGFLDEISGRNVIKRPARARHEMLIGLLFLSQALHIPFVFKGTPDS